MRVVQVVNHAGLDRGGAERVARGLHQDLCAAGHDARLIALEACDVNGLDGAQSLGFSSPRDPRTFFALARALKDELHSGAVLHAHLFPSTLYVSALKQVGLIRVPCSMTEHSTWNRRRGKALWRALDRRIYRGFDRIVAISAATQMELLKAYPGLQHKTSFIENGVALSFETPPARTPDCEVPLILTVGRLTRAKNIDGLLLALTRLTDQPWRLEIVGDGSERARLEALVEELGLQTRVQFAGQQSDVTDWLARADLFVMPSHWEGFGLAAVEAMNAGLPVVATDVPGLRDVVGPTGAPLVAPDDTDALAEAIARLLGDPFLRATLGARGHVAARAYGRDRMLRNYYSMWRLLPEAASGKRP